MTWFPRSQVQWSRLQTTDNIFQTCTFPAEALYGSTVCCWKPSSLRKSHDYRFKICIVIIRIGSLSSLWVDKWVVGLFIWCVLRWRHLVNAYEVKAHRIGLLAILGAVCFWQPIHPLGWLAEPGCCCPAWQCVCRVIAALRVRLLYNTI